MSSLGCHRIVNDVTHFAHTPCRQTDMICRLLDVKPWMIQFFAAIAMVPLPIKWPRTSPLAMALMHRSAIKTGNAIAFELSLSFVDCRLLPPLFVFTKFDLRANPIENCAQIHCSFDTMVGCFVMEPSRCQGPDQIFAIFTRVLSNLLTLAEQRGQVRV